MTLTVDEEVAAAIAELVGDEPPPAPAAGDWQAIRDGVAALYPALTRALPDSGQSSVSRSRHVAVADDGYELGLEVFTPSGGPSGSAVLHAHGGGMIAGTADLFAGFVAEYVARSGVPFVSVDYRLAPQVSGDRSARDVFAGLQWLHDHASELGTDRERIAVMGESAGGGLAASTAIQARDAGIPVAKQILIYPMLDDRTDDPDPQLAPVASWPYGNNVTAWNAVLGADRGTAGVSAVIAPARLNDHAGLPPAYIEVGELDIFRSEDCAYAAALWAAGVSAELHVLPGLVHGWDHFAPTSTIRSRVLADRVRTLRGL